MIDVQELLKSIPGDKPCGEDLSYNPRFQELETIMKGRPETQFSAAEEPDWTLLRERCLELWPRSKDLRLVTALSLAALKTDGLPAFNGSLALLKGLLEQYWDSLYPLLDPADNNDPTQRLNIITALATPKGTFGDPMRLLERLAEAPLASSARMGRFSFADILKSESKAAAPNEQAAPNAEQIAAAFRDTDPEVLQAISRAVAGSLRLVQEIDAFLTEKVGSEKAPDLDQLSNQLKEMQKRLTAYTPGNVVSEAPSANGGAFRPEAAVVSSSAASAVAGEIQSRQDVVRMLEKICDYYKRQEPSSPVPYVLRRAQRLAAMDFMEIVNDLSPDSVKEIQRITGEKPKERA